MIKGGKQVEENDHPGHDHDYTRADFDLPQVRLEPFEHSAELIQPQPP